MTRLRTNALLAALGIPAAAAQLVATRWGLAGNIVGGFLCGVLVLAGMRVLALEIENIYLPPLVAAVASLLGLVFGVAGSDVVYPPTAWIAPLLATLPLGAVTLGIVRRGKRCQLCRVRLRGLLFFSCPRCQLVACENCWQFERDRCSLCEANQISLLPVDIPWWRQRFGSQVYGGRCALCLRNEDGRIAHWACAACGHGHCRSCWDDNNGQCSRCGWTVPDLGADTGVNAAIGARREKISR
ncbi:MAG: hypothetical protein JWQ42_2528 [Edaphobacter sp.]|nr:hypothetical protein [Edaphobacter sp.]